MTDTKASVHRRYVLAATAVFLAGCNSQETGSNTEQTPTATDTETPTDTPPPAETPTDTPPPEPSGWSVSFEYDGNWQGSVSVTTEMGDSHQAFDGQGNEIVDVESQLGVETQNVQEIVVMAQKRSNDDQTLRVTIRKDGDVVAEGSTDVPRGQVMVSHNE